MLVPARSLMAAARSFAESPPPWVAATAPAPTPATASAPAASATVLSRPLISSSLGRGRGAWDGPRPMRGTLGPQDEDARRADEEKPKSRRLPSAVDGADL